MDYEDIEKKLETDAENVKQKAFSNRWAKMQLSIEAEDNIKVKEPVINSGLVTESVTQNKTASGKNVYRHNIKIIVTGLIAVIVLVLAIVLPLTLRRKEKIYYNEEQLHFKLTNEDDFYSSLRNSEIKVVDLKEYTVENYSLFFLEQGEVKGGGFEFVDESLGCYANVIFYDSTVIVSEDLTNYEICDVRGTQIKYVLKQEDGFYSLSATTVFKEIFYRFDCDIIENNIYEIFDKFLN